MLHFMFFSRKRTRVLLAGFPVVNNPGDDATEGFSKFLRGITRLSGAAKTRTDGGGGFGVMFDVSN